MTGVVRRERGRRTRVALLVCTLAVGACAGSSQEMSQSGPLWEDPDGDPYNFHRSVTAALLRTFQYAEALRNARKLVKLRPDEAEPYVMLARSHIGLKQLRAGRTALERAIALDPEYAPAHAELGTLLDMQGEHRKAEKLHRKALALAPDEAAPHNNLGFCLYLQGRYWDAVASFRAALERDPSARRVHNNLGFAYGKLDELDKAYHHFLRAGRVSIASNNMGYLLEEKGDLERAFEYYVIALTRDPELLQARRNLERVAAALGRPVPEIEVQSPPERESLPPAVPPPGSVPTPTPTAPAEPEAES